MKRMAAYANGTPAPASEPTHHHLAGFWDAARTAACLERVRARPEWFRDVGSRAGLGPRYRVIDGERIAASLPDLLEYASGPLRETVERVTGRRVELMGSLRRALHVQVYATAEHGFRWHFDGHAFAALLTLANASGGATQIIGPRHSRWLRLPFYAAYPWPRLFSILPRQEVTAAPGDLLILHGGAALHRGTRGTAPGERWLLVFNYDDAGRRLSPLRDWIAKRLNY